MGLEQDIQECSIDGCNRPIKGRGWCNMHWIRWRRSGHPGTAEPRRVEHGLSEHPLYSIWEAMRDRCTNPRHRSYKNYGGRGIKVCARWDDFTLFLADMGARPDAFTIERIDVNGDYEPSNCIWASRTTQALNRRFPASRASGYRGVVKAGNRWSARIKFERSQIWIGNFATAVEAAWMYDQFALELHRELAQVNLIYKEVKA